MKLAVHNAEGKQVRQITVDDAVFGITPNLAVLHQAFVAQRANQRRGTASTKSRGEVQGSTRKMRRQKYTGSARQGSNRSPVRTGGGVAFGPRPRSYRQDLPKKMRRLAIRSALSGKLADGQLHVIDKLGGLTRPRTKEVVSILHNAGIERSALIVTGEPDRSVLISARNLPKTKVLPAPYLNVVDLLTYRDLLLTEDAVRRVEGLWGAAKAAPKAAPEAPPVEEKPRRRRAAVVEKPAAEAAETAVVEEAPKPRRRRAAAVEKPAAEAETSVEDAPKPARRAARPRAAAKKAPAESPAEEPKPARRRPRARKEEA
jgi:large subunit ribosomal protein L4